MFFSATAGAGRVARDFRYHANNVIGLGSFSDLSIVILEHRNPGFIHEMIDQPQNALSGNFVRAREIDAHPTHLFCQFSIIAGLQPAQVELRTLPTETEDRYDFILMKNLNDGFPAVTLVVGAVSIEKTIFPVWQVRIISNDD